MALPLEESWMRVANQRLADYYRLAAPSNPDELHGIDRFVRVDLRSRVFEAIGHRYVCELQHLLTVPEATRRMSRAEWRAFLEVPESTLSRWRHDQHLAGGQYYFAVHHLRLNLPVGSVPFPSPDAMLKGAMISLLRHLRFKYMGVEEPLVLTAATFDHVVNLMHLMSGDPQLVYNPFRDPQPGSNRDGLRRYAGALFRRRHAKTIGGLPPTEIESGINGLTDETQSWIDHWGLPYALLAAGYRTEWRTWR
jgi:hypothetical protein